MADRHVVSIFHRTGVFVDALRALTRGDVAQDRISVLARHQDVMDKFGQIPSAEQLADRPDTPREDLTIEGGVRNAIHFLAETVAVIGEIGAAGLAYAVGGPVGVAASSGSAAAATLEDAITQRVGPGRHEQFAQSVRDGGAICWVLVADSSEETRVSDLLREAGGDNVHTVDF